MGQQDRSSVERVSVWILLGLILALTLALRIYRISEVPAGIYPDEAVNGTDALRALETGKFHLFYPNNYGREGLFINLIALSITWFGNTILGLKFWSTVSGTLTVLGVFLLAREMFRNGASGLIAAFLVATSFWAINFSRIALRAVVVPLVLTFGFYFLVRGLRRTSLVDSLLAGLIFGVGLHTYPAFRASPLVLIVFLAVLIFNRRDFLHRSWKLIAAFGVGLLVTAAPMLLDFFHFHPEHYASRTSSLSVFRPEVNHGHPLRMLGVTIWLSIQKYFWRGDLNWRHNYPPYPILNPLVAAAFLIGLLYAGWKSVCLGWLRLRRGSDSQELEVYVLLLAWFGALLVPEFLAYEGNPHALRSIGTLPAVFILATIPFQWLLERASRVGRRRHRVILGGIVLACAAAGTMETVKYFVIWAHEPRQHREFAESYKLMSDYLVELPATYHKYVLANAPGKEMDDGLPVSAHVIKYLTYKKADVTFLTPGVDADLTAPLVIVFMAREPGMLDVFLRLHPAARAEHIDRDPGFGSQFTVAILD